MKKIATAIFVLVLIVALAAPALAMRENALFHYENCADYRRLLDEFSFDPRSILRTESASM